MPQPDLIWADKAIHDIKNLLDRRDDREGVLRCVESHLLAAAEDPLVLWTDEGPQPVASHRFECRDGETKLFLVSKKHLDRYMGEFEFRYNHRKMDDGARTVRAIQAADGRRLRYKEQVSR